ncbi:MAG: oxalate/formate MFS antiporter [Pseudomonadota bacterium]|nr:oxalate/formate MFS antiporter [Pseudomonadota bacterium]
MSTTTAVATPVTSSNVRWLQLLFGLVCMMAISSPQYVWALFTKPLGTQLGASAPAIQVTFSILIVLQTFFSPFQGWLVERFGPRWLIAIGCALTGLSWVLASSVTTLVGLYATYGLLGGLGTGIVYIGVVGLMVRWFPEHRGFAAGVVAAGYGMGAIATTFPIADTLAASGVPATLLQWGLILGAVGMLAALGLRAPPAPIVSTALSTSTTDFGTGAMLRSPVFWLMFVMMSLMSTSGLMVTSQLGAFAADFGVSKMLVWGMAAVPLALTIDRFCNGLTRPFFGWVSDRIGRENTMAIAFALEGAAMTAWLAFRGDPVLFVLLSGLVFFGWGEIFSLFPSTLTDTFGPTHATQNYGCLYIAQGIGAILGGPMAALLHDGTGSWTPVFAIAIGADFLTALLAIAVLKPMRQRFLTAGLSGRGVARAA